MSETKVPSIPAPTDANLRDVARAIKGVLDVREGLLGDPLDANVTFRDLADGGVINVSTISRGGGSSSLVVTPGSGAGSDGYDPTTDLTPPPAPTGFTATGLFAAVQLSWASPPASYANHAYTEIWRASPTFSGTPPVETAPVLGNAVRIGTTDTSMYVDYLGNNEIRYYWIRFVSQADVQGPYNATNGTRVVTAQNPGVLINSLQGAIKETELFSTLGARINLIDAPTTGLVTKVSNLETTYGSTASAATSAAAAATSASAAAQAEASALLAQTGAQTARDQAVTAKTNAETAASNASTSATSASNSATGAAGSASQATTSATNAANSASAAGGSATSAANSASSASTSATNAGNSATAANSAKVAAESARDGAQTSAAAAATSAQTATTKATEAGQSATSASTSATNAATSASNAATSATQASTSETNAAGSASSASTSATNAANSANAAGGSATAAAGSASSASTSATNSGNSATAANTAKVAAESARDAAQGSASAAAISASTASTKATEAGQSATAASASATNASTSASSAGVYASNAATSASGAAGSASSAATSLTQLRASVSAVGLIYNSSFEGGDATGWTGFSSITGSPYGSLPKAYAGVQTGRDIFFPNDTVDKWFACNPGEQFEASAWVSAQFSSPRWALGVQYERTNGTTDTWTVLATQTAPTTAKFLKGYWTAPADARRVRFWGQIDTTGTVNPWHVTDVQLRRADSRTSANAAAIQTLATTVAGPDGATAQYTVKVDANGYVAGFGLSSSSNTAGAGTSTFAVRADQFYIASPSGPGVVAPTMPFIVRTTPTTINGVAVPVGVYIADAFIQNGTISNAKIGDGAIDRAKIADLEVTEAKIGNGAITNVKISGVIQSDNYVAGTSGWAINKTGGFAEFGAAAIRGQLTASQIDSRGLTIKDNSGNIILAAGTPLAASNITPAAGWLNSNVTLGGLGYTGDTNATFGASASNFSGRVGGGNLVGNSGFKRITGTLGASGSFPVGWGAYNWAGGSITYSVNSGGMFGTNYVRMTVGVNHSSIAGIYVSNTAEKVVDWALGEWFGISFWARAGNSLAVGYKMTPANSNMGWTEGPYDVANPGLSTSWQQYIYRARPGNNSNALSLGELFLSWTATGSPSGTLPAGAIIDFCAVQVERGDVATAWAEALREKVGGDNPVTASNISTYIEAAAIGSLDVSTTGKVRSGKTSYGSGTGWLLEYNGGTPRFDIGDSDQYMRWTGSALEIKTEAKNLITTGLQSVYVFAGGYKTSGTASGGIRFESDGEVRTSSNGGTYNLDSNWFSPTTASIGSSYYIRFSKLSGVTPTGDSLNTWLQLNVDRTLSVSRSTTGASTASLAYEISNSSSGSPVLSSGYLDFNVEVGT